MDQTIGGLQGKAVLITGGASGIGLAAARCLHSNGCHVYSADIQPPPPTLAADSGIHFAQVCTTDADALQQLTEHIVRTHGRIDGLVASAGISLVGDLLDMNLQEWQNTLETNLTGTMLAARAVASHMKAQGQGSIVTIASINGILGGIGNLGYCVTKGGVIQMTRVLAADLGRYGVRVNCISPGLIDTPMTASMDDANPMRPIFTGLHLLGRAGQAPEVGRPIAFLLSDQASFITGCNLPVDGGYSAAKVLKP